MKITVICRKNVQYKDGKCPLFIRFTHNRTSKLIGLGITIPPDCWDAERQIVTEDCPNGRKVQFSIDSKLREWEKKIDRLEAFEMEVTFDTLFEPKGKRINCTVNDYFTQIIERLESAEKYGSGSKHRVTRSLLNSFRPNARFTDIDLAFLNDFEIFLRKRGNQNNSIATKFSVFKAVYNKAIAESIFIPRDNPFLRFKVGRLWTDTRKRSIVKEDIIKLTNITISESESTPFTQLSQDIFIFSYLMAGINFKDIAGLRHKDIYNGRVYYKRHKTGKEMNCPLIPQAKAIIDKYSQEEHSQDDYIFPILDRNIHITEQQKYNRVHKVLGKVNRELHSLGEKIGLNITLTTYVARHSFATVLKRSGVNIAIISESLGHSDLATTQIYLDSFENSAIDEAMKNLL